MGSGSSHSVPSVSTCRSWSDRENFNFPSLRCGHARAIGASAHQPARRRPVGNEDHTDGNLPFLALESRFAVFGSNPNGTSSGDPQALHVVRMHRDGIHDRLVLGVVFADVDLLALLAGAGRIHDEALIRHLSGKSVLI